MTFDKGHHSFPVLNKLCFAQAEEVIKPIMLRLAARYLLKERRRRLSLVCSCNSHSHS